MLMITFITLHIIEKSINRKIKTTMKDNNTANLELLDTWD